MSDKLKIMQTRISNTQREHRDSQHQTRKIEMKNHQNNNHDCGCAGMAQTETNSEGKALQPKSLLASDSVAYGYDSRGRLNTVTYQNGTVITYSYDSMGNRTSVVTTCPGGTC